MLLNVLLENLTKQTIKEDGKMETIHNYLDSMFVTLPQTPETIKAKAELRCIMEDKYNELISDGKSESEAVGTVISEFGDLKELAEELGIKELVYNTSNVINNNNSNKTYTSPEYQTAHMMTVPETKDALKAYSEAAYAVALGVFLCICAPTGSVLCDAFGGNSTMYILMDIIGSIFLFAMVGAAVSLFIIYTSRRKKYKFMRKEVFVIPTEMIPEIREMYKKAESERVFKLVIGIMLCIFSVVPSIVVDGVFALNIGAYSQITELGGLLLFVFVGIGVFLIVNSGMLLETYKMFLKYDKNN